MTDNINILKIRSKREFRNGEPAYDVRKIGKPIGDRFYFELDGFDDSGVLYFDGVSDRTVQSIGQRLSDGKIIASLLPDLYGHPDFKCIWLI